MLSSESTSLVAKELTCSLLLLLLLPSVVVGTLEVLSGDNEVSLDWVVMVVAVAFGWGLNEPRLMGGAGSSLRPV